MTRPLPSATLFLLAALAPAHLAAQSGSQAPIEVEELPPPAQTAPTAPGIPSIPAGAAPMAPGVPADPLAALEVDAQNAYADGDLPRALTLYLDLGQRHTNPVERARVRIVAAWLAWQLQDTQSANTNLEAALYEYPMAEFRAENYSPEFAAAYQDALAAALDRRRRTSVETINRASAEMRAGRMREARDLLGQALALTPDDPDAVYNLALVELREGKQDAALAGFERVLALERGNPDGVPADLKGQALNNAAVIYFGRGEFADSERALDEAVRVTPNDAGAWLNLGLTRQRLGKADTAYEALKKAHELKPGEPSITRELALAESGRKNWVAAVALLVEATQARPADPDLLLQLARAQSGLGNATGAIDSLRKAIELDPNGEAGVAPNATLLLTDLLRAQGDLAGAVSAAERATVLEPQDASAWLRLGLARYEKGELAPALEAIQKAGALAPDRADIAHNRGMVQMAMKDYAGAEASFDAALAKDPSNTEAKAALDQLHKRLTDLARAALARGDLGATLAVADYAPLKIQGLRVDDVPHGSAAQKIGLQKGDLLLRVDGRSVESIEELRKRLVGKKQPPVIDVLRSGAPVQLRAFIN